MYEYVEFVAMYTAKLIWKCDISDRIMDSSIKPSQTIKGNTGRETSRIHPVEKQNTLRYLKETFFYTDHREKRDAVTCNITRNLTVMSI